MREGHKLSEYLTEIISKYLRMVSQFICLGTQHDSLYETEYNYIKKYAICSQCDAGRLMNRVPRLSEDLIIYYDLIASGDRVMRYEAIRDRLRKELDILYFKMEARV